MMSVGIVCCGVIAFVLHQGVFEGRRYGFVLVHELFGLCVAHSHIIYSDATVFGVVFDDHDCFFLIGCYIESMQNDGESFQEFLIGIVCVKDVSRASDINEYLNLGWRIIQTWVYDPSCAQTREEIPTFTLGWHYSLGEPKFPKSRYE